MSASSPSASDARRFAGETPGEDQPRTRAVDRTSVRELVVAMEAAGWREVLRSLMHRTGPWVEWLCREQRGGKPILFFAVPWLAIFGLWGLFSSAPPIAWLLFALSIGLAVATAFAIAHGGTEQAAAPAAHVERSEPEPKVSSAQQRSPPAPTCGCEARSIGTA